MLSRLATTTTVVTARSAQRLKNVGMVGMVWSPSASVASSSLLVEENQLQSVHVLNARFMSSGGKNNSGKKSFRPRRRPSRSYRPLDPKPTKVKGQREPFDLTESAEAVYTLDEKDDQEELPFTMRGANDGLEGYGHLQADVIRLLRRKKERNEWMEDNVEDYLRSMDYFTSETGSTEDLIGERRALADDLWDFQDRDEVSAEIERLMAEARRDGLGLETTETYDEDDTSGNKNDQDEVDLAVPDSQLAHGDWGEVVVSTDMVRKMWRGGRLESYRALVVAGNLNGCGGFGVGKGVGAEEAVEAASREAKRNLFFVDRYRNRTLTHDLVGRQNSCKVYLRSTENGLRGNPLVCEILQLMGITDVVAKAHGNRNPYNVVRATYKALLTHESLEEISRKRGVRLVNLEKAKRLRV